MEYFAVKNWQKFQHYKSRNPPWIKLYYSLLSDRSFRKLTPTNRYVLMGIWLLAGQYNNCLEYDASWLSDVLATTRSINLKTFLDEGWIYKVEQNQKQSEENASNALATCVQNRVQRQRQRQNTDKEEEKKESVYKNKQSKRKASSAKSGDIPFDNPAKDFIIWYCNEYQTIKGSVLVVSNWGRAIKQAKNIMRVLELPELRRRATEFIQDDKAWPLNDRSVTAFLQDRVVNTYDSQDSRGGDPVDYSQPSNSGPPDVKF